MCVLDDYIDTSRRLILTVLLMFNSWFHFFLYTGKFMFTDCHARPNHHPSTSVLHTWCTVVRILAGIPTNILQLLLKHLYKENPAALSSTNTTCCVKRSFFIIDPATSHQACPVDSISTLFATFTPGSGTRLWATTFDEFTYMQVLGFLVQNSHIQNYPSF